MENQKNNIDFYNLMDKLKERLALPLPGEMAHQLMAVKSRMRLQIMPNSSTKKSAVLILFYPFESAINIPLILRPPYDGLHGGQMAFPGGRNEKTDENLVRTALREAQEEIGIRIADVTILGQLSELYIPPSNFLVQPVVGFMHSRPTFYPDSREVETIFEISLEQLINPNIISEEILNVRGVEVEAPIYAFQNHKVWGATAMMIAELLMVLDWKCD